jgi:hypothetical protein
MSTATELFFERFVDCGAQGIYRSRSYKIGALTSLVHVLHGVKPCAQVDLAPVEHCDYIAGRLEGQVIAKAYVGFGEHA